MGKDAFSNPCRAYEPRHGQPGQKSAFAGVPAPRYSRVWKAPNEDLGTYSHRSTYVPVEQQVAMMQEAGVTPEQAEALFQAGALFETEEPYLAEDAYSEEPNTSVWGCQELPENSRGETWDEEFEDGV